MNNLGKCIKDIPFNKIYEGMRVATGSEPLLGKVIKAFEKQYESEKQQVLIIDWDKYPLTVTDYKKCSHVFYVEENK